MTVDDLRIIVGASSQHSPGWIRTQQTDLDLTRRDDWANRFKPASVSRILAEHVWEHLSPDEARVAARVCFEFLAPGGFLRCAVPDGCFPNEDYQRIVQVGGPGPSDHPAASHRVVYDYRTLVQVFVRAGLDVRLLEWWDEHGKFHAEPWDERDGFVYRSLRFDHRNQNGSLIFTSLMLDAVKP
ncbi:MAG: SAM-dependent methyltransferase [Chloroflexia bacterium]|nr:SAM-dependent methyltransferase [Chloroflexia bacterium]